MVTVTAPRPDELLLADGRSLNGAKATRARAEGLADPSAVHRPWALLGDIHRSPSSVALWLRADEAGDMPIPEVVAAAIDLALPVRCAGCRGRDGPVCRLCAGDLRRARARPVPSQVHRDPCAVGFPETWAAGRLDDTTRRLITAYKDEGRRDLAPVLGALLAAAVAASIRAARADGLPSRQVLVVPVPTRASARRQRGDAPMTELARTAARLLGPDDLRVAEVLVAGRRTRDQAHLSEHQRADNLVGAWEVAARARPLLAHRLIVVVDDIVTSGATLVESVRALRAAAGPDLDLVAAVVSATPRTGHPVRHS